MRRIPRRPLSSAVWKRWGLDCSKAAEDLAQQVARGEKPVISDLYKRKSIKDQYFFAAGPPFYGKCAYCEAPIRDYQHGDVEHFRPKAGVTDENGQPVCLFDEQGQVQIGADGEPVKHPGYYWLAYEWTNLLPTCVKCNQDDDDRRKACREAEFLWARLFSARHDPAGKAETLKEMETIHRGERPFTTAQVAVLRELAELAGLASPDPRS